MNHGFETGRYPGHWRITGKQTIIIHVLRVTDAIQKACISYRSSHVPVNMLALAHLDRIHWPEGLKKLNLMKSTHKSHLTLAGRFSRQSFKVVTKKKPRAMPGATQESTTRVNTHTPSYVQSTWLQRMTQSSPWSSSGCSFTNPWWLNPESRWKPRGNSKLLPDSWPQWPREPWHRGPRMSCSSRADTDASSNTSKAANLPLSFTRALLI